MDKLKLCLLGCILLLPFIARSQDTVVGWTFPNGVPSEVMANFGSTPNIGISRITALDTNMNQREVFWRNGAHINDYAATVDGWDHGDRNKFWQIAFMSKGYKDLFISSKQRSGEVKSGPKYFNLQYRIGSGQWTDIPDATIITIDSNWTSGVVSNIDLPNQCDNLTDTVYIRWLMHPNIGLNGYEVLAIGTSKIDDIFITGTAIPQGVDVNRQTDDKYRILPNVSAGLFKACADNSAKDIMVLNSFGEITKIFALTGCTMDIDLSDQSKGIYFVVFRDNYSACLKTEKIVICK